MSRLSLPAVAAMAVVAACSSPQPAIEQQLDALFAERYHDAPMDLAVADGDSVVIRHEMNPGAAVIIAQGDSILYERYFGTADLVTGEPIGPETLFNIASVSKQFTVAALLQQPVDIDAPASDFFDYPQPFWHDVTLAHLASHSSGIPDSRDRSDRMRCVLADDSVSVSYFPTVDSLQFAPGTAYDYLNPSFILLAQVVEQQSGMEFTEYMSQRVFKPLDMSSTVYFSPDTMPAHTAHAYVPGSGMPWIEYDYGEETFFATRPDGGIYSTARDMLKWERGLASGKVLAPELLAKAYAPRINVADSPWCDYQRRPNTWYGLGWFVDTTPGRPVKVYHTGDNGGFQAYVAKYPTKDIRIIVLENRNDRDRWAMAEAIDQILKPLLEE